MSIMAVYVPLIQTAFWVLLIMGVLFVWRKYWSGILGGFRDRIAHGDSIKFGAFGLSAELERASKGSRRLEPQNPPAFAATPIGAGIAYENRRVKVSQELAKPTDAEVILEGLRQKIGQDQRGVHLVHVAAPSAEAGQTYDLFVHLTGWQRDRWNLPNDLSDVATAEFHVGPKFVPSGVVVRDQFDKIGFTTSAYGPVLCICRVTFSDGHVVILQRYLDFEAAELTQRAASAPGK